MSTQIESTIANWNRIHKQTTRVMAIAPNDQYGWRPHETAMTLGELMNHLFQSEMGLADAVVTGVYPKEFPSYSQTAELIEAFDKSHAEGVAKVTALSPEALQEEITPFGPQWQVPRMVVLNLALEHEIHHRGQLYTYLRILGCELPSLFG
jgi:uncharacterized damage-inducible protein DinB